MYFRADLLPPDEGFGWISNTVFNKGKYLTVKQSISLDECIGTNAVCNIGPALINSESDYRGLYLERFTQDASTDKVPLVRFAPCDTRYLYDDAHNQIKVDKAGKVDLRIDYLGAEDGGWQYWVNGIQAYIDVNLSATLPHEINYSKKEDGTFLNSALQGNPRLGTYLTVASTVEPPLVANGRVEGRLYNASVEELEFISNMSASASATYVGSVASNVLDGNINTVWNSGSFSNVNPWIELDLGSTQSVKKVRMLTLQSPAGNTTHLIYAGNTPNPTTLIATKSAFTSDNQWINIDLSNWISARYIRIKTINSTLPNPSPSWVAWRDIQVYK